MVRADEIGSSFHVARYHSTIANVDRILAQLRVAAATKGPEWLHNQAFSLLEDQASGSAAGGQESQRAQRSMPLECFSPGSSPQALRHGRSPTQDPSGPPAKHSSAVVGGASGWNPCHLRSSVCWATGCAHASPPPILRNYREPGDAPRCDCVWGVSAREKCSHQTQVNTEQAGPPTGMEGRWRSNRKGTGPKSRGQTNRRIGGRIWCW